MKYNYLLFIPFISISCSNISPKNHPEVFEGNLDLSAWDLDRDGPVELFGEFEFHWNRLLTPEDLGTGSKPEKIGYITAPGAWNGYTMGKTELGSYGYATYRVRVKLNKKNIEPLGIRFSNEIGAFRVYVNKKILIAAGTPGKTVETTVPDYSSRVATFVPHGEELDILVQASNFHAFLGGMVCNIHIGTEKGILQKRIYGMALDLFLIGTFFIMGLYHLGLFIIRRSNKAALYFGLLCFVATGYNLIVGEKFFNYAFSEVPWNVSFRIIYFLTYCIMITVLTFCYHLFKEDSSRKIIRIYQAVYMIFIITVLVANSRIYTFILLFYYIAVLLGFIYVFYIGIQALIHKRSGALIYIAGFTLMILSSVNDMLYTQKVINTGDYMPFALVCFFFSQAYMLAYRFSQSMEAEEKLTGELTALMSSLEQRVQDRTIELETANEEMKSVNEDLTATRNQLWGEMELAQKIQTVLLPQNPAIPGYEVSAYMKTADDVGGDYYDIINAGDMHWLVIGDVSGHGVPAGLIMMMVETSIHTVLKGNPDVMPSDLLDQVNKVLVENLERLDDDMYMTITVFACISEGRFHFSGLHQDILIYRAQKQAVEIVETTGIWLGLVDDLKEMIRDDTLSLNIGDSMILYTDGITEARKKDCILDDRNIQTVMFGEKKLADIYSRCGGESPETVRDEIIVALNDYSCADDVTMIVVKRVA